VAEALVEFGSHCTGKTPSSALSTTKGRPLSPPAHVYDPTRVCGAGMAYARCVAIIQTHPTGVGRLPAKLEAAGFDSPVGALRGVCLVALGKVRRRRQGSNSAPNHAISAPRLTGPCALFALAGAATLLETATNGNGSMPYLPGLAAAIRGTAAGLAAVPQSVPPTVRSSARLALPACCSGASVAMRRLCCQRRRRRAAQASRPCCPRLTCVFPACLPCAQPPPRRLRGASRGADMARCGPLAALTAANGRPTRMPTAADCAAVTTSMGGVCVVLRGAVAADVAAVSGMRARLDVCSIWVSAR